MSRDERSAIRTLQNRVHELEGQLVIAKVWARGLWKALSARTGFAVDTFLEAVLDGPALEHRRILDVEVDAAEIIWRRHHVLVEPCRVIIDAQETIRHFVVRYPNGDTKNVNRDQLLWMAGIDPDPSPSADPEVPF